MTESIKLRVVPYQKAFYFSYSTGVGKTELSKAL